MEKLYTIAVHIPNYTTFNKLRPQDFQFT